MTAAGPAARPSAPTQAPAQGPAIDARGLAKSSGALETVTDFTLSVERGEPFAPVGPDGAGKTTTLRMFCGIMDPPTAAGPRCWAWTPCATPSTSRPSSATCPSVSGSTRT